MVETTPEPLAVIDVKYCDTQPDGNDGPTPTGHCANEFADMNRQHNAERNIKGLENFITLHLFGFIFNTD
jgi:hypothetical protein